MTRAWPAAVLLAFAHSAAGAEGDYATLADAAMNRDGAAVRTLLAQGADPNALGTYGTPALHWVVRVADPTTASLLLDAGADPNLRNAQGVAPLHVAIANRDLRTVELLLEAEADAALVDQAGETPLMLAARAGSAAIASRLLAAGAVVDAREIAYDQTALMIAAREGHADVVRLLLRARADVNAATRAGDVPAFRRPADNAGSKGIGIIRGGWPEHGMRPPVPGAKTPLLYAARRGDLAVTQMLVGSRRRARARRRRWRHAAPERDLEREHCGSS